MRYGLLFGACFLSLWGCQAPVAGQEIPERFESVSEAPLLAGVPVSGMQGFVSVAGFCGRAGSGSCGIRAMTRIGSQ